MTDFLNKLAQIGDKRTFTSDPHDMEPWLTDWRGRYHGKAMALVSPTDVQQLSEVVKLAAQYGVAIVPQGGNSGMVGGATPDTSGQAILLSTRRMKKIRQFDISDQLIVVEAGVILQNLHEIVENEGLRFALTLGGKGSATIGGLISTNAGGTQVLRHGNMRALVHGIEAVLPDGSIFHGLSALKKDNRGYDIKHLLIGAEGTLGIVTAATLQLVPNIIDRCVIWVGLQSTAKARETLLFMQENACGALEGFEIIPEHCLDSVIKHIPGTRRPIQTRTPWHALIEIVRDDESYADPSDMAANLLEEALKNDLINDATFSINESQAEAFWKIRDSISEAERANGPAIQHDISLPVADMGRFIDAICAEVEHHFQGVTSVAFGHMGDGNIHLHVLAPAGTRDNDWPNRAGKNISTLIYDRVTQWQGSISAEHGIGQLKLDELERLSDPTRLMVLRAIKSGLDPQNIMNPGKVIMPA